MDKLKQLWQKIAPLLKKVLSPRVASTEDIEADVPQDIVEIGPLNYERVLTKIQEHSALIYVTLDLQNQAPISSHTNLLELVIRLNEPDASGLAGEAEAIQLEGLRDQFMQISDAIFVGSVTASGMYNAYIYLPTGVSVPDDFKRLNIPQQYSFEIRPDPSWQYYFELLPTLSEAERIINARELSELMQKGVNLTIPHQVLHTIVGTKAAIDLAKNQFANSDYQLSTQASTDPNQMNLLLTKTMNLSLDLLTEDTIELSQTAEKCNAIYQGWTTIQAQ